MACVVIVRKREDFSDALILDETPQNSYPTSSVALPIDDRLIPGRKERMRIESVTGRLHCLESLIQSRPVPGEPECRALTRFLFLHSPSRAGPIRRAGGSR